MRLPSTKSRRAVVMIAILAAGPGPAFGGPTTPATRPRETREQINVVAETDGGAEGTVYRTDGKVSRAEIRVFGCSGVTRYALRLADGKLAVVTREVWRYASDSEGNLVRSTARMESRWTADGSSTGELKAEFAWAQRLAAKLVAMRPRSGASVDLGD